jgi:hypothetical protein
MKKLRGSGGSINWKDTKEFKLFDRKSAKSLKAPFYRFN